MKHVAVFAVIAATCALACRAVAPGSPPVVAPPSAAAAVPLPAGTVWLILVDDLHLDFRSTGYLRDFLKRIGSEVFQDGDSFALRSTGPSDLAIGATSDRSLLEGAIRKTTGAGLSPIDILSIEQRAASTPRGLPDEVLYRAKLALTAAQELVGSLEPAGRRRRALIYISNGYNFDPSSTPGGEAPAAKAAGRRDFSIGRLREQVSELADRAKKARVRIFAIDPRGLALASKPDPRMDVSVWATYLATTRASLRFISEQTGGFLEYGDLAGSLTRISRAMRDQP